MSQAKKAVRKTVDRVTADAVIERFAAEFAAWRLQGCPGYGFAERFKADLAKAARGAGLGYSQAFAEVHRIAYLRIDAAQVIKP